MVHLLNAAAAKRSGIVNHDIEPATGGCGLVDHGTRAIMVGDIDLPEDRLTAVSLDQAQGFLAMRGGPSGNDNGGTFARKGACDCTADALTRAGNDGNFARKWVPMRMSSVDQAASSMMTPLASKPWLARSSCCE